VAGNQTGVDLIGRIAVSIHPPKPWIHRLYERLLGQSEPQTEIVQLHERRPTQVVVDPESVEDEGAPVTGSRTSEEWQDLMRQGRRVAVTWDGGPHQGSVMAQGEIRLTFDETVWIWLDQELPEESRPQVGQAIQVLAPRSDALRLIPCRLVEESGGSSIQVAISGRVSRLQRRDDVRMRVELPPISAVRFSATGKPLGLLGLTVVDLSAGGIRLQTIEKLRAGERLRIMLRLDEGDPITPIVEILVPGTVVQGRFEVISEADRRRIVQYVYRQELAERRAETEKATQLAD
jgi:hypothetical protein